ncbi:ABC transporter substrate-binding protein [Paenibacillus septentrionalis]|uniref:ABC transporter substrate-binding protein n=1 Tax=Paenibacillus septentrionalis TaxID=429342 RepID=A0ABW1V7E2_9BACL
MTKKFVILLAIVMLFTAACGNSSTKTNETNDSSNADGSEAVAGGLLKVGVISDFGTLDPARSTRLIDEELYNNIYDPLVKLTPDGQFIPGLATEWEISGDGKTYTFTLREGVKFHDGTDFNAQAVIDNWEWIMDPANASPRSTDLVLVEELISPDPYTLIVQLKTPFTPFIATITGRTGLISSMTAKNELGDQYEMNPVGTGPFKFISWNKNEKLVVERNPDYWVEDQPKLDAIEFIPITNPSQKLNALISGQVDLVDSIPFQDIPNVEKQKNLIMEQKTSFGFQRITMNLERAPFNNEYNRRAVNYAINRDELNALIYFNTFVPGYSFFSPAGFANDPGVTSPFDLDLAKEELVKAGNPDGFVFKYLSANDPQSLQISQLYQSQLAKVGITMEIEPLDSTALTQKRSSGDWDAVGGGWSGMIDPDQNSYAFIVTDAPFNYGKYSNPTVDELMQLAREKQSEEERTSIYKEVSEILLEDVPSVFTGYQPVIDVWVDKVEGFEVYPDQLLRFHNTTISK